MSSNLDKLKALSSRLEEKIEKKRTGSLFELEKEEVKDVKEKNPKNNETPVTKPVEKPVQTTTVPQKEKSSIRPSEQVREENIARVKELYNTLKIFEKSPDFDNIFIYKAMNLSGIGLKEDDFGQLREGKYIQIIAITYEPDKNGKKKAKNISLGYFGKAETLEEKLKNMIIEFVLRWRYEKAFQNVEHYKDLIAKVEVPYTSLF